MGANLNPDPGSNPATLHTILADLLGTPLVHSDNELASLVEDRLPVDTVKSLKRGGLNDAEVYDLIIPRRTLAHRTANGEPLTREESDRAVRVARIAATAEQVFGDVEKSWRWLRRPMRQLGGRTPIAMLATEVGARVVEEVLARIDYGMFA